MALLEILKDQSAFGFTGKINILVKATGQFYGVVYQSDGHIVDARASHFEGRNALLHFVISDVDLQDSKAELKYVVEPEILDINHFKFKITYEELKQEAEEQYTRYLSAKKFRPPDQLRLLINPEIVVNKDDVSSQEFELLTVMSEWSLVSDIYKHARLFEYEVTEALVSLRRKKAIKVFQN